MYEYHCVCVCACVRVRVCKYRIKNLYIILYVQGPLNGLEAVIGNMEEVKENKKVLYHFAIFAIVNELLIIKNHCMSPVYCLMQIRDKRRF